MMVRLRFMGLVTKWHGKPHILRKMTKETVPSPMECVIPLMIVSERNSAILPTGISTEGTGIGEAGAMARAHRVTPLMVGLVHGGPFS